ncbi:MAG: SDR family oxidoreductase [Solirubrobacterales bacterium]|nr:SDR family oxidoreductase [Solirubrobacterales bacterium]
MADGTVLITGATSGLGLETAKALGANGATVILGARDQAHAEEARRRVSESANGTEVHTVLADLTSLAEVRRMAQEVKQRFARLDVLINNAGIDVGSREVSVDGYELTFAVNYLAPFLLTHELLELLRASAPSRVLNVASSGYKGGELDFDDLQSEQRFSGQHAYNNSKLALVIFTYELARRLDGSGVSVNAVDPGFVRGTHIGRTLPFGYRMMGALMLPFMASVEKGADTAVWAASEPALSDTTGRYFKRRRQVDTDAKTRDPAVTRRLWEVSEQLVAVERTA